jgi:signal recognition particle receptor subunit beta
MSSATNYKIIITGPVGAGKTTAIAALSDIEPITTDEAASDMTGRRKPKTTVALDYGMMKLPNHQRIHLYGTPGQERFDFMWEILVEGGIGLVLLLDGARPAPHKDMLFFLDAFRDFIGQTGVVIGVTRTDLAPDFAVDDLHDHLRATGLNPPVFTVDARERADIQTLVKALLYTLDPGLDHAAV